MSNYTQILRIICDHYFMYGKGKLEINTHFQNLYTSKYVSGDVSEINL